jgi:general secretion pathway protein I
MMRRHNASRLLAERAFSLLEVMVALAIFGMMITGILAAQATTAASNKKAANMGLAVNLARCKMTELEEKMLKFGYPEADDLNTGAACCEGEESSEFSCDTKVERVTLPEPPTKTMDPFADGGASPMGSILGANSAIGSSTLDFDAGLAGLGTQLQTQTGGTAGLLNMALGFVYPTMKPMMEASIRRVTVVVHWKEGPKDQELQIVQFVTNPQRGGFVAAAPSASGAPTAGAPPVGGAAGAGVAAPPPAGGLVTGLGATR